MNALLIAGTDTEVGKTVVTTALMSYGQTYWPDRKLGLMKPVQTGLGDRELYHRLFQLDQTLEELNPIYLEAPLAPPIAAQREGRKVDLGLVWRAFEQLRQKRDWVLLEALGGLGSPVTAQTTVADLAWDWRLPTVLVVPVKLGAIAQAVANVALARQCRVHLRGIVFNCLRPDQALDELTPKELIESLTNVPVLGAIPYLEDPTDLGKLAEAAAGLDLERLWPL